MNSHFYPYTYCRFTSNFFHFRVCSTVRKRTCLIMVMWLRTTAEIIQKIRGRGTNKEMESQARLHRRALGCRMKVIWRCSLSKENRSTDALIQEIRLTISNFEEDMETYFLGESSRRKATWHLEYLNLRSLVHISFL